MYNLVNSRMNGMNLLQTLNDAYSGIEVWSEVREVLESEGKLVNLGYVHDPFQNLVMGILAQNTSDRNRTRAYVSLAKKYSIEPCSLSNASESEIRECIKIGGMHNIKAKKIKELADVIYKNDGNYLASIINLPKQEAINALVLLPGIGIKTADVCIAYCSKEDVIPIDTNIKRVAKRLGLTNSRASYKQIQHALEQVIPLGQRVRAHELFIRLGKDFCKPRNPKCKDCPIRKFCNYF